jgi:hypothetical protein
MKRILFASLFVILLFSCRKAQMSKLRNQFSGTWELERLLGYDTPLINTFPPGNGNIIYLGAEGSFERRKHDTVTFKGTYFLGEKKDCYGDEKVIFLTTNELSSRADHRINIDAGKLFISTINCYADGGGAVYRKK